MVQKAGLSSSSSIWTEEAAVFGLLMVAEAFSLLARPAPLSI